MCGIAGIYDPQVAPDERELEAMSRCQYHRGPDDTGTFQDGPIGLSHRRLSIVDLETGRQPVFNETGSVAVVFNGEIYNFRELKRELQSRGHQFSTNTDTEVIAHAYEQFGESFMERLRGMFAFALWDSSTESLYLVRDRFGIKPLVVARNGAKVAFASEVSGLLETSLDHGGLDIEAIGLYFAFGYVPAPKTIFTNFAKLRPGEYAKITEDKFRTKRYYRPQLDVVDHDVSTAARTLRELVDRAVERRLMSDVPLGAFLSGGVDSSIIVGTMAELCDEPVKTFTVGFDETLFDESRVARTVADHFDTDHHEYVLSPDDLREVVPTALDRLGEPYADQSLVPTYAVANRTSRHVKVALSGDGADELFFGYDRYRAEYYSKYYRLLPDVLRQSCVKPVIERLPASRAGRTGELSHAVRTFTRGSGPHTITERQFEWLRYGDADAVNVVADVDVRALGERNLRVHHTEAGQQLPSRRQDDLARFQTVDMHHFLPNRILTKSDLAGMYNSLEVRVPFVDRQVVEYALSLPTEYKITPRNRKRVLKRAFSDRIPSAVRRRGKQGFDMPIGEWFKHELADEFEEAVHATDLGVLDTRAVMDRYHQHVKDRKEYADFLWSVYVFKRWGQRMKREGVL